MSQAGDAIAFAQAQIGKPYKFGHTGPDSYDCSGLIYAAYKHASPPVILVPYTVTMLAEGRPVAQSQLQPGDLIFPDSGHVVLYIGNNEMIKAPHEGAVVRQGPVFALVGGWRRKIVGCAVIRGKLLMRLARGGRSFRRWILRQACLPGLRVHLRRRVRARYPQRRKLPIGLSMCRWYVRRIRQS